MRGRTGGGAIRGGTGSGSAPECGVGSAKVSEVGPRTGRRQDEAPEGKELEAEPDEVGGGTRRGAGPRTGQGGRGRRGGARAGKRQRFAAPRAGSPRPPLLDPVPRAPPRGTPSHLPAAGRRRRRAPRPLLASPSCLRPARQPASSRPKREGGDGGRSCAGSQSAEGQRPTAERCWAWRQE